MNPGEHISFYDLSMKPTGNILAVKYNSFFINQVDRVKTPWFAAHENLFFSINSIFKVKFRPKHLEFDGVSTWEHSSFDGMKNAMRASQDGLKIYSEPFVELFGIPLMYNYSLTDPDLIRSFFNSDQEQGSTNLDGLSKRTKLLWEIGFGRSSKNT